MQERMNLYNLAEDEYSPEQERDFINNLFEVEVSQDIQTLLLRRLYKDINEKNLNKTTEEEKELFIKELLRKIEIMKKIIHDRPELAKKSFFINAIVSGTLAMAEKFLIVHNNIEQRKTLQEYQQIMTTGLKTEKAILPAVFKQEQIQKPNTRSQSIEKLLISVEKNAEINKRLVQNSTLNSTISSVIQILKDLFTSNKEHKNETSSKMEPQNYLKNEDSQKKPVSHVEKLALQREEEERKKQNGR